LSAFGGPAWTFDSRTGQSYLHQFLPEQPDLNWWNPSVRQAFDGILRFWFDRGVAGFRIDVAHSIVKDRELRDNPPPRATDHPLVQAYGQRTIYNTDRPEVHEVLRRWRQIANAYDPPRLLVGETVLYDLPRLASYYGQDDELHLPFNFPFLHAPFEAAALRTVVEATEAVVPASGWPVYTASNHDNSRFPTRWCQGDPARVRSALMMLLSLRGTPFLYYGDEIGMPDTGVPPEAWRDPLGLRNRPSRDPERTPMPWTSEPGAGFTSPSAQPWLPFGDVRAVNVADQRRDPKSILSFVHDLIAFRRTSDDLRRGSYAPIETPAGAWAWRRGAETTVALNPSEVAVRLSGVDGVIRVATSREREGETVRGTLALRRWEGVILT